MVKANLKWICTGGCLLSLGIIFIVWSITSGLFLLIGTPLVVVGVDLMIQSYIIELPKKADEEMSKLEKTE